MKTLHSIVRPHVAQSRAFISRGRSSNSAGLGSRTPIRVDLDSDAPPALCGQPYLKTCFRRGHFRKILYTPSTLHVTVGAVWLARQTS